MRNYIKNSVQSINEEKKTYYLYNTPIHILNPFTTKINFSGLLEKIEHLVPEHLLNNVEVIYIADVKEFNRNNRSFNALYKDGAIYVSPEQDNEEDLMDDIIHEIAHSFEKEYEEEIYGDDDLEREFLAKRRTLYHLIDKPTFDITKYINAEYNAKFDDHLHNDLNYDYLRNVSSGLFYSPYAITSLREYWANGFENYLLGDKNTLKELSPILFSKVETVLNPKEKTYEV